MNNILSPEEKLLIRLSKIFFDDDDKRAAGELLSAEFDTDYFLELCKVHHTLPMAYRNMKAISATGEATATLLKRLKTFYKQSLMKNMMLFEECKKLIVEFEAAGVKAIVNQGMALIATIYSDDIALRPMMDMDFLLRKSDLDKAKEVLLRLGFRMHRAEKEAFAREFETSLEFMKKMKGFSLLPLTVELHYWDDYKNDPIGSTYDFDVDGIFSRVLTIDFDGVRARILSREDFLVHHIFHMALSHQFTRQIWFDDIAQILSLKEFDYELFGKLVNRGGLYNIISATFAILERINGSDHFTRAIETFPPRTKGVKMRWGRLFTSDKAITTGCFFEKKHNSRGKVLRNKVMLYFSMMERGRGLKMLKALMFPSPVWLDYFYGRGTLAKSILKLLHPLIAVSFYVISMLIYLFPPEK